MHLWYILAGLVVAVVLLDKFHSKLPPPFPQIHKAWMTFAHFLGGIMSWIILSILWIVAFGPYAIVYKLMNKKQKIDVSAKTYWIDVKEKPNLKYQF